MTYQEYFKKTSSDGEVLLGSEQRWGYTNRFFKAYSSDPEKSMHFMKSYAAALLPGLAAVLLLCYTEAHAERLSGVLIGDFALLAVNAALALAGVLYRRRHPMDPAAAERLREKRRKERAYNRKHWKKIAVRGTVCAAVLLLILYIFVGGTLRSLWQQPRRRRRRAARCCPNFCRSGATKQRTFRSPTGGWWMILCRRRVEEKRTATGLSFTGMRTKKRHAGRMVRL